LEVELLILAGARVILTSNTGLVNGALGVI
jgi:hypothetical protein